MKSALRKPLICFVLLLVMVGIFNGLERHTAFIEYYYSRVWYPIFSYLPQAIFGYLPFSIGDLWYTVVVCYLITLGGFVIKYLFQKQYVKSIRSAIYFVNVVLGLYLFFYVSWGMHYYRAPLAQNVGLNIDSLQLADYLVVLENSLDSTNAFRDQLDPQEWEHQGMRIRKDMETWVRSDTTFQSFLSTTLIHAKGPINSNFISYFGVSGYFNPFTHEAQINTAMPAFSSPFTYIHELAHQQGIGFEDEANFIAYVRLKNHPQVFYRYSSYLQTTSYLLQELKSIDKGLFTVYKNRLSKSVLDDLRQETVFWSNYTGWINNVSGIFYNGYLKHNNQAEGLARYDRMTRLVVAYELKRKGCR